MIAGHVSFKLQKVPRGIVDAQIRQVFHESDWSVDSAIIPELDQRLQRRRRARE